MLHPGRIFFSLAMADTSAGFFFQAESRENKRELQVKFYKSARRTLGNLLRSIEKSMYSAGILSASRLSLPDFLGIGAMKSGTTWLYENLRFHPEIYLPATKELYYFSIKFHGCSLKSYSSIFEKGSNLVKGDITPGYSTIAADRIRFIHRIMPDVKLIFLMRNPVHRTWSEAYMNLVAKPGRRIEEISDDEFLAYFRSEACRKRSDYLKIIDNWLNVFSSKQLFISFLDEIEEQPRAVLRQIFSYLGVSNPVDWKNFPSGSVVIPHYEPNRMVYRGKIRQNYKSSDTFLPDRFRKTLENMYEDQMLELYRRYQAPIERWRRC